MERTRQIARNKVLLETILGRRLYTPDIWQQIK